ncbi:hypothetical protein GCM10020000_79560 [Streptomyces olivoverticillatus]
MRAQGLGDGHAGGAVADGGDEAGFLVGLLVEDECLLAGEVLEERGGGHVGGLGDLVQGHRVVAAFDEEVQGGVGERFACGGLLALAPSYRCRHARIVHKDV